MFTGDGFAGMEHQFYVVPLRVSMDDDCTLLNELYSGRGTTLPVAVGLNQDIPHGLHANQPTELRHPLPEHIS